jgi:hypothetical protein
LLLLTTSVDDQLPCCATNVDRGNVGHIFVGHGAGADEAVAIGFLLVVVLEPVAAVRHEVLNRSDALNLRHLERGRSIARLDGRGRYRGCCCCHEGDGSLEVHVDDECCARDRRCLCGCVVIFGGNELPLYMLDAMR